MAVATSCLRGNVLPAGCGNGYRFAKRQGKPFSQISGKPRKMGISRMSRVARPLRRLRTVHPDI